MNRILVEMKSGEEFELRGGVEYLTTVRDNLHKGMNLSNRSVPGSSPISRFVSLSRDLVVNLGEIRSTIFQISKN